MPPAFVVAVALVSVAVPLTTVAVTTTPAAPTALPAASRTCTTGWIASAAPLAADVDGWVDNVRVLAGPAPSVTPAAASTDGSAPAVNRSAYDPVGPDRASAVNAARPAAFVVTLAPVTAAPPPTTAAITPTPACGTSFPLTSRSWTAGCGASATPLCAAVPGSVTSTAWLAAPAASTVADEASTGATPGEAAVKRNV